MSLRAALGIPLAFAVVCAADEPRPTATTPTGPLVTLRWTASKEHGTYGYLVYRAERRDGPFVRVNPTIIRARGVGDEAEAVYVFVDEDVASGRTYHYYLDVITDAGAKQRFSGVLSRTVVGPEGS